MLDLYEWIETGGGPHLLVPEELLSKWRGIDGWSNHVNPNDQSDYARACRITSWIGTVRCGDGSATVLAGDVGPIAWINADGLDGGYLVQWLGIDNEADILPALSSKGLEEAFAAEAAEQGMLETGGSGKLKLIDSADIGTDLVQQNCSISLKPGRYNIHAGYFETETLMMVVRKMVKL